ncbi:MAG: InlB B-repeat-containing protein [Bacilli bacterium]|nr:InlB B-repeat-containing protein [Bacilli bacterium]
MFFSKLLQNVRTKVMMALAGFTMLLGAGAAVSVGVASQENEVVETKAEAVTSAAFRIYMYKTFGGDIFTGIADKDYSPGYVKASISANTSKYIPASGTTIVGSSYWNGVADYEVTGRTSIAFTFYEGDVRWLPTRGTYNLDQALTINGGGTFTRGYIYHLTNFSHAYTGTNWYDSKDYKNRDIKFFTYSLEHVGYFVHYDLNGGSDMPAGRTVDEEQKKNANFTLPGAPTRYGYTFMGWKDESNGFVNRASSTYYLSGTRTFTAIWMSNTQTVIPNGKTRIFIGYDGGPDTVYYKEDAVISLKLWGDNGGDATVDASGTYYNTNESISGLSNCPRRYDYFDIDNARFNDANGINVRRGDSVSQFYTRLTSSSGLKVFYCPSTWEQDNFSFIGGLAETDALFAAIALCGIHTCSSSALNGYGAFDQYNDNFYPAGGTGMSSYTINDFANGDTSYSGSTSNSITAAAKHSAVAAKAAGGSSAQVIPGAPRQDESPLTLALWIVLAAGLVGVGSIGVAYFVTKKKKKHEA